jgi:predicted PurR-regulated permease PerM
MPVADVPFDLMEVKLAAPLTRPGTVAKADVIARLCTSASPFATVVAPAGYGKTTLLAWWAQADPRPFAWVALDGRDDDAVVFLRYVAKSLRSYFLGVTIIAAFNGAVIGAAALILGVPLAGTIAVVTFVAAYVPFVGAWVAGAFAVLIALGTVGTTAALTLAVVALLANGILQQLIQPLVMGATLGLNPLVVLVVTIGAGCLFGMVGLTLAAPLTSAAVHIANELRDRAGPTAVHGVPHAVPPMPDPTAP